MWPFFWYRTTVTDAFRGVVAGRTRLGVQGLSGLCQTIGGGLASEPRLCPSSLALKKDMMFARL